ncbi:MAG TPA: hypothetical protein PLT50_03300, partial [bacterium]|nr:hypothetical protein [bacterium]
NCLGTVVDATEPLPSINKSLREWALLSGNKSALPYCSESGCGSATTSDFRNACEQNNTKDYPLRCYGGGEFFRNRRICSDGTNNLTWVAAASNPAGARILGSSSCSYVNYYYTSSSNSNGGFRVVLRP